MNQHTYTYKLKYMPPSEKYMNQQMCSAKEASKCIAIWKERSHYSSPFSTMS